MNTVTIPKKEYNKLLDAKLRYEYLRMTIKEDIFAPPPIRNVKEIVKEFLVTKKYKNSFLKDLETGLKRSSHFK